MEILSSVISGIVSGTIASLLFYQLLKHIKPKITVSDNICAELKSDGSVVYRIKVVNNSKLVLTNFDYCLQYLVYKDDHINSVIDIDPNKVKLGVIHPYNKNDINSAYAVRLTYKIPLHEFPLKKNTKIIFTFYAEHPYSSSVTCVTKEYSLNDVVFGTFETGTSMKYTLQRNIQDYENFEDYAKKQMKLTA